MNAAEADGIPDRGTQELADRGRPTGDQFAQFHGAVLGQLRVEPMLDAAAPLAVRGGELQRVVAGRQARARDELERRRYAVHQRRQAAVDPPRLHFLAVLIEDRVADRHAPRGTVSVSHVRVNEQLHSVRLGPLKREGCHAQRQGRHRQRRSEAGGHGLLWRTAIDQRRGVHQLTARTHHGAVPGHVDAEGMRPTVTIARIRLDAQPVIAGKLRLETFEHGRAAGRVRKRFETEHANPAILDRRRRPPPAVRVEGRLVDVEHVQVGSRRCGQQAQLIGEGLRVVDDEARGDQDESLRRIDRLEAREEVDQPGNRGIGLLERLPRNLTRVVFDAGTAHRIRVRARGHVRAFPRDRAVQHSQLAPNNRQRLPQPDVVRRRRAGLFVVATIFASACIAGFESIRRLIHPAPPAMSPGTLTLDPSSPVQFVGSDGGLQVDVPTGAITSSDIAAAGGRLGLLIRQIAPASGGNAGGSGHVTLGTFLFQVVDAAGGLWRDQR